MPRVLTTPQGRRWDSAVSESLFATLTVELLQTRPRPHWLRCAPSSFDYLELFYNGQRQHSALGHLVAASLERSRSEETVTI